jgi:hypothetical protein
MSIYFHCEICIRAFLSSWLLLILFSFDLDIWSYTSFLWGSILIHWLAKLVWISPLDIFLHLLRLPAFRTFGTFLDFWVPRHNLILFWFRLLFGIWLGSNLRGLNLGIIKDWFHWLFLWFLLSRFVCFPFSSLIIQIRVVLKWLIWYISFVHITIVFIKLILRWLMWLPH